MSGAGPAVTLAATITVATVMLSLGVGTALADVRRVLARPAPLARALAVVLVLVPAAAVVLVEALGLDWDAKVGVVLMAIAPAAPLALRRSTAAGGDRGFATTLQTAAAAMAVVSMPLSLAALNAIYAGRATIEPAAVAGQVLVMQFLPLAAGVLTRLAAPALADRMAPILSRAASLFLGAFLAIVVAVIWRDVAHAGAGIVIVVVLVTGVALLGGHLAAGPDAGSRAAGAVAAAARNAGLALLVASRNAARPGVVSAVMVYLVCSAIVVTIYLVLVPRWHQRWHTGQ